MGSERTNSEQLVTAESRKQDNELGLGAQKKTRGQTVKYQRSLLTVRLRVLWLIVIP
jgi:hypothetical protein